MTPEFTKTQISQNSNLGNILKSKREELGLSVKEVELATKIRAKYIDALERGDYSKLLDEVYVRGFLRSLADFLNLEYHNLYELYKKDRLLEDVISNKPGVTSVKIRPKKKSKIVITPKTAIVAGVVTGIIAITAFILWQFSIVSAPPEIIIESPENNSAVETDAIIISGTTSPGANLFINEIPIQNMEGSFKETISLQDGHNIIKVVAVNQLNKKSEKIITVIAKLPKVEITPMPIVFSGLEIKVTAGDYPITLDLLIDGKDKAHQFLMPGTTQVFKAVDKISFSTSNAKSTKLVISNEKMINKDIGFLKTPDKKTDKDDAVSKPEPLTIELRKDVEVR